jgi:SAM-dependent methyltransferase
MDKESWLEVWRRESQGNYLQPFTEPMLHLAFDHLADRLHPGAHALDLGCGNGLKAALLTAAGACGVGLDINADLLAKARIRFPQIQLVRGDSEKLPFADASFDAVFSFSTLQYVDLNTTLGECRRVLKPGGRAVFIENLEANLIARCYRHLHRWLRWRYVPYQTPRAHLKWEQHRVFGEFFAQVRFDAFHLTTPITLVPPALAARLLGRRMTAGSESLYRMLRRIDIELLGRLPFLSAYGWLVVIRVIK